MQTPTVWYYLLAKRRMRADQSIHGDRPQFNVTPAKREILLALVLIASAGAVLTYNYVTLIELGNIDPRLALHHKILDGHASSPYNYRVLVPFITESFAKLLSSFELISYKTSWVLAYVAYDYISITLFLITLLLFLKQWHSPLMSLTGVLFCATLLPISLRDHYFQPWSLLEAWLFCAALLATFKKRYILVMGITILASLNRETGIFIPFIYLLGTIGNKNPTGIVNKTTLEHVLRFAGLIVISASIAIALRYTQGFNPHIHTLSELWTRNTSRGNLILASVHISLFAGAGWVIAILGMKYADSFTRRTALLAPLYVFAIILFGVWMEVRLLIPLYPIIISLCLFYIGGQLAQQDSAPVARETQQ